MSTNMVATARYRLWHGTFTHGSSDKFYTALWLDVGGHNGLRIGNYALFNWGRRGAKGQTQAFSNGPGAITNYVAKLTAKSAKGYDTHVNVAQATNVPSDTHIDLARLEANDSAYIHKLMVELGARKDVRLHSRRGRPAWDEPTTTSTAVQLSPSDELLQVLGSSHLLTDAAINGELLRWRTVVADQRNELDQLEAFFDTLQDIAKEKNR